MRIAAITAAVLSTLVFCTQAHAREQGGAHSAHGHHGAKMESSRHAAQAPFDLQFIDTMIMHHQSAIDMARLAESRAAHPELKRLARKMQADQQAEIGQMKAWRQQWYPGQPEAMNMDMPGMAKSMEMDMDKLTAARGNAFDAMFITMMKQHHRGAVTMAADALHKAGHAELKKLAQEVVAAQEREVALMEQWRKAWKLPESR